MAKRKTKGHLKKPVMSDSAKAAAIARRQSEFITFLSSLSASDFTAYLDAVFVKKVEDRQLINASEAISSTLLCLIYEKTKKEGDSWHSQQAAGTELILQDCADVLNCSPSEFVSKIREARSYFQLSTIQDLSIKTGKQIGKNNALENRNIPTKTSTGPKNELRFFVDMLPDEKKKNSPKIANKRKTFSYLFDTLLTFHPKLAFEIYQRVILKSEDADIGDDVIHSLFGIRLIRLIGFLQQNKRLVHQSLEEKSGTIALLSRSCAVSLDSFYLQAAKKLLLPFGIPEPKWENITELYGTKKQIGEISKKRKSQEFSEWKASQSILDRKYTKIETATNPDGFGPPEPTISQDNTIAIKAEPNPNYKEVLETNLGIENDSYVDFLRDIRQKNEVVNLSNSSPVEASLDKRGLVKVRHGQQSFREIVLEKYSHSCAISGCSIPEILEAAHIVDYSFSKDNSVTNGVCLRADIHTLFDRGYLFISMDYTVAFADGLSDPEYLKFEGKRLQLPEQQIDWPKKANLDWKLKQSAGGKTN